MKFNYTSLESCSEATRLVIIIDVLRAFSNAAYAFEAGAKKIFLVSTVEEALAFKKKDPNILAMGEIGGLPPKDFDLGNSPTETMQQDLSGRTLVQRTGAGTQGAVRCVNADVMLASSFVVAGATVKHVQKLSPDQITLVISGVHYDDEDLACAEYLEALLRDQTPDVKPFVKRVYDSKDAEQHLDPNCPEFLESDFDYCTRINRINFSMPIRRENGQLVMRAVQP
jgi:2-phosphosulfolactate phosphatase